MFVLGDVLRRNAAVRPTATALLYRGAATSFEDLHADCHRLAQALLASGVVRGDHVAILAKNSPEYATAYFGCPAAGAILTCVNYRLSERELVYVLGDCEARVLLLDAEFGDTWQRIAHECPRIAHVVLLGDGQRERTTPWREFLAGRPATPPDLELHEDDVALQMYTSGTTGVPKGAMLTHRNLLHNSISAVIGIPITPSDTNLISAPFYHMAAGLNLILTLLLGARVLVHRDFNPSELLEDIEKRKVTHSLLIPAMLLFLLRMPGLEKRDLSSLKGIIYGASPIPLEVLRHALQIFDCGFYQAYGQTEGTAVFTILNADDHRIAGARGEQILKSAGREIVGVELRVADEHGEPVARGEWGEVIARGPSVMKGYWNMPDKTAETIRKGWLWTGDIGYQDEEGYLYIVDRSKDMIISGGENIYPREIEEVLFSHAGIADAAVIGVPSDRGWGEDVKACVVRAEGAQLAEQEVIDFCRARLAHYKCPRSIDFLAQIPRNLSGKVLKKDLRAPYWKGHERGVH